MWFPKEKLPVGKLWLNQGISGDSSTGVLRRLSAFSTTRPEVIYVMIGINDLLKGDSDQTILLNHRRIIRSLRQTHPKSQIMVQSILPVNRAQVPNRRIRHINAQIALIARQEGANYLNIHNWFTDFDGNLRSDLTTDGVHLSPTGYAVWQAALQQIEYRVAQRQ
jgi:lysophospholipase L1-like esterase